MVLLVIDTQALTTNRTLYNFSEFKNNIKTLIKVARDNQIEVIYVRHDDGKNTSLTKGKEGYEIYEEFKPQKKEKIFDKTINSAFKESGLLEYLKSKQEKEIIIVGLQTEYCIDANVKCGFEHGFHIIVPAYCNTTVDNAYLSSTLTYEYYNKFIWNNRYAECVPLEVMISKMKEKK